MKYRNTSHGFSLIELIVVVAIMAVLVGVLAPSSLHYVEKSREGIDAINIRGLYSEMQAEMYTSGGMEDIETAKVLLKQNTEDWQYSTFQTTVYNLTDTHDEKPLIGGTAWIEYNSTTGSSKLCFGTAEDAVIKWPELKTAGAMANAFSLNKTIYGGDSSDFTADEKALVQELKKKMNWGDGITIHIGNKSASTVMISCVNENLISSDYTNSGSWGKQTIATRIVYNYNTNEIVSVVEQGGKWGNNAGTQGFWANKEAKVIYSL